MGPKLPSGSTKKKYSAREKSLGATELCDIFVPRSLAETWSHVSSAFFKRYEYTSVNVCVVDLILYDQKNVSFFLNGSRYYYGMWCYKICI